MICSWHAKRFSIWSVANLYTCNFFKCLKYSSHNKGSHQLLSKKFCSVGPCSMKSRITLKLKIFIRFFGGIEPWSWFNRQILCQILILLNVSNKALNTITKNVLFKRDLIEFIQGWCAKIPLGTSLAYSREEICFF